MGLMMVKIALCNMCHNVWIMKEDDDLCLVNPLILKSSLDIVIKIRDIFDNKLLLVL